MLFSLDRLFVHQVSLPNVFVGSDMVGVDLECNVVVLKRFDQVRLSLLAVAEGK